MAYQHPTSFGSHNSYVGGQHGLPVVPSPAEPVIDRNGGYGRGRGRGGRAVQLPPGWEQQIDPSGTVYYVDHNTQTTHWEIPQALRTSKIDIAKRKTKMCTNFLQGSCKWGGNCAFAHYEKELVKNN